MTTSDRASSRKLTPLEAGDAYIATLANVPLGSRDTPLPGGVLHDDVSFSEGLIAGKAFQAATGRGCSVFGITAALAAAAVVRAAAADPEPRKALLALKIADGKLVISIGVDALAHAVARSPALHGSKVTNADAFAKDLLDRLGDGDDETGLSLIQHALDDAAEQAAEQGSKNIVCPGDGR